MSKKTIMVIFGTRPEAIKMAPIVKEVQKDGHFNLITCVTGQHRQMLDQVLSIFNIVPDVDLNLMSPNQTLSSLTAKAILNVSEVIEENNPDVVLVQGDTTTAMVAGLASFYQKIPVGHIEAGLRTSEIYDPFPEEINRRILSTLTSFHFAPTQKSLSNLEREGFEKSRLFLTGNTVIDALLMTASMTIASKDVQEIGAKGKYILVTAHRRENFGEPIKRICAALKKLSKQNPGINIIFPVHLNPKIQAPVKELLSDISNVYLIEPLEYKNFVHAVKNAYLILTDSGGVQEEAPSLGKPVLVMRETTERPEAVSAGVSKLVGTDTETIVNQTQILIDNSNEYRKMANNSNPFGDGTASRKIVEILKNHFS